MIDVARVEHIAVPRFVQKPRLVLEQVILHADGVDLCALRHELLRLEIQSGERTAKIVKKAGIVVEDQMVVGHELCGKQPGERVVALRHMVVIKTRALVGDIPHRDLVAVFFCDLANALYQRAFQMLRVVLCPVRDADGVVLPNEVVPLGLCAHVLAKFQRRVCRRAAVDIGAVLFEAAVPLNRKRQRPD